MPYVSSISTMLWGRFLRKHGPGQRAQLVQDGVDVLRKGLDELQDVAGQADLDARIEAGDGLLPGDLARQPSLAVPAGAGCRLRWVQTTIWK